MYDMRAGVDANGNIVAYEATGFGQGGTSLYTGRELLGSGPGSPNATANALPTTVNGAGAVTENLSPWMKVSGTNYKVINKPIDSTMGIFHSGPLRAPGAQQTTLADAQTIDDAGGGGEHGRSRVPPAEHEHRPRRLALGGGAPGSRDRRRLEAVGCRARTLSKDERRHRPRDRQQPPRRRVRGGGGRHPGEQEDRQDHRHAHVRGRRTPGSR